MIDDDLAEALDRCSAKEGISKAALIRRLIRSELKPLPPIEEDPLWSMVGVDDYEPVDIDDVVYR
jgi:hypothetical protein